MPDARPAATADSFDPPPTKSPPRRIAPRRAPLPWPIVLLIAVLVATLLWGAWVTKAVLGREVPAPAFAAVRLQPLVAEYVEAQARTRSPEEQVTRETQAFMARLDSELQARGRAGTTILVAEAVVSKNVPDITDEVRRAVHNAAPLPAAAAGGPNATGR